MASLTYFGSTISVNLFDPKYPSTALCHLSSFISNRSASTFTFTKSPHFSLNFVCNSYLASRTSFGYALLPFFSSFNSSEIDFSCFFKALSADALSCRSSSVSFLKISNVCFNRFRSSSVISPCSNFSISQIA